MNKIKNIFEQLADAIIISDEFSRMIFVNTACEHLFGYHPGELAGKSLSSQKICRTKSEILQDLSVIGDNKNP